MNSYAWSTANLHTAGQQRAAQQHRDWELGVRRGRATGSGRWRRWAAAVARVMARGGSCPSMEPARPAAVR